MLKRRLAAAAAGFLLLGVAAVGGWLGSRQDPIPAELPPLDPALDLGALCLPEQGDLPGLCLRDLRGGRAFLFLADDQGLMALEGWRLRNALARWTLPAEVRGIEVAAAPGVPDLLRGFMERMMSDMRRDARFPMYVDYGRTVAAALRMPRGHMGLAILDPRGEVLLRHSGDADPDQIERVRGLLGAQEPPPPPPSPPFTLPGVAAQATAGKHLLLVFLHRRVTEGEVRAPGMLAMAAAMSDPSRRLLYQLVHAWKIDRDRVAVAIAGELLGLEDLPFLRVQDDAALREAFGIPPGEAGLVVVDRDRRLVLNEHGTVPLWQLGIALEGIGAEPSVPGAR